MFKWRRLAALGVLGNSGTSELPSLITGEIAADAAEGVNAGGGEVGDVRPVTEMPDDRKRRAPLSFGLAGRLPVEIEWLSDNGSPYTARETRVLSAISASSHARPRSRARNRTIERHGGSLRQNLQT